MSNCTECGEQFNPELSGGVDICQDCFDSMLDCKACGDGFDNDINNPVDNCPECEAIQGAKNMSYSEIDAFILNQVGAVGFTEEIYKEYGVNANQVLAVARMITWAARTGGKVGTESSGITAVCLGHPSEAVISYQIDGECIGATEWLEAISGMLADRFEAEFAKRANE